MMMISELGFYSTKGYSIIDIQLEQFIETERVHWKREEPYLSEIVYIRIPASSFRSVILSTVEITEKAYQNIENEDWSKRLIDGTNVRLKYI